MKKVRLVKVLRDINSLRRRLGKKAIHRIPKGLQQDVHSCPIARATGMVVDGDTAECFNDVWPLTKSLKRFVERFDDGKYPHLID